MNSLKKSIFSIVFLILGQILTAQVGINTTSPNAVLDITASDPSNPNVNDGLLIPRIDAFPSTNPSTEQNGMLMYLTTTDGTNEIGFYYWDSTSNTWSKLLANNLNELSDNDGDTKIQLEKNTDEDIIRFTIRDNEYFNMNQGRLNILNTGNSVFIGDGAGANDDLTNNENVFIGKSVGLISTTASNTTAIGNNSSRYLTSAVGNTTIGAYSGRNLTTGRQNTLVGYYAGASVSTGERNIMIGRVAGENAVGSSNIFIGNGAGRDETGSNKLYIDNQNVTNPLIWGDFSTNNLVVNGTLGVMGNYIFPTTDGTTGQVLTTDGAGNTSWLTVSGLDTDNQFADVFQLSGNNLQLSLDGDGIATQTVDLSGFMDNTDSQDLTLSGSTLSLTNDGTTVDLSGFLDADNLGNHTATTNIQLGGNWLSNDGGSEGVFVDTDGNVGVGTSPTSKFTVRDNIETAITIRSQASNADNTGIAFQNTGGHYHWGIHRENTNDLVFRGGTNNVAVSGLPEIMRLNTSGVEIGGNYTLPLTDGLADEVLKTNGSGVLAWSSLSVSELVDADNDTKVQVEESTDEDIIRFDMGGQAYFKMDLGRFEILNTGNSVFIGEDAGLNDDLSNSNVFVGYRSGRDNTTGFYNTAIGYEALAFGATSDRNVAIGHSNSEDLTGGSNTSIGGWALASGEAVDDNVVIGVSAMRYPKDASNENVVIGVDALRGSTSLNGLYLQNVMIGARACESCDDITNAIAIGYNAEATSNNQARIGNSSISSIGGYANWTNLSDGRFKTNVKEDIQGLDFILKLRPVSYRLDMDALANFQRKHKSKRNFEGEQLKATEIQTGFIAQEVEQAARETNFNFHGVDVPKNEKSHYGLRYAEFVVPLTKAVQEQQAIIEKQQKTIDTQNKSIELLNEELTKQKVQFQNLLKRINQLEQLKN